MNPKDVLRILQGLAILPYFVNNEHTMNALVRLCGSMCRSLAEVQWLVNRMTSGIYSQWPGPAEMRACFCCRYRPKDGVSAYSTVYPDGLPPDPTAPPRRELEGREMLMLPPGHSVSVDKGLDELVCAVAATKVMPSAPRECLDRFGRLLKEIATPPQDRPMVPKADPISDERRAEIQSQINAIKRANRDKRAERRQA